MREDKILDKTYEDQSKKSMKSSVDNVFNSQDNFIKMIKEFIYLSDSGALLNKIFAQIDSSDTNICSKIRGFLYYSLNIYEQYSYQSANIDFTSLKKSKANIVLCLLNNINLNSATPTINNHLSNIKTDHLTDVCVNLILFIELLTNYILDVHSIEKNYYVTLLTHVKDYLHNKIISLHEESANLLLNINSNIPFTKDKKPFSTSNQIIQFRNNIKYADIIESLSQESDTDNNVALIKNNLRIDQYNFDKKEALLSNFLNKNITLLTSNTLSNEKINLRLDQYINKLGDSFQIITFPNAKKKYGTAAVDIKNRIAKKIAMLKKLILKNQYPGTHHYEKLLIKYLTSKYYTDLSIVKLILLRCDNINYVNQDGNNALHLAVISGRDEIVTLLLQQTSIEVNIQNMQKQTALYLAIKNNVTHIAKLLIQKGAKLLHHA